MLSWYISIDSYYFIRNTYFFVYIHCSIHHIIYLYRSILLLLSNNNQNNYSNIYIKTILKTESNAMRSNKVIVCIVWTRMSGLCFVHINTKDILHINRKHVSTGK